MITLLIQAISIFISYKFIKKYRILNTYHYLILSLITLLPIIILFIVYNKKSCPNNCSEHGICKNNKCECVKGWTGEDCSVSYIECPNNCSKKGTCNFTTGLCLCDKYWTGLDCNTPILQCPNDCLGLGVCDHITGICKCNNGSTNSDCHITSRSVLPWVIFIIILILIIVFLIWYNTSIFEYLYELINEKDIDVTKNPPDAKFHDIIKNRTKTIQTALLYDKNFYPDYDRSKIIEESKDEIYVQESKDNDEEPVLKKKPPFFIKKIKMNAERYIKQYQEQCKRQGGDCNTIEKTINKIFNISS
jgi:hypothetical protein